MDRRGALPTRAGAAPYPRRDLAAIRWLAVHHTGDGPARPTARDVASYQTGPDAGWPFPAIAYPVYVEEDGTIEVTGDLEDERWVNGVGSPATDPNGEGIFNQWTFAVCFSGQDPTAVQWGSVLRVRDATELTLGRPLVFTGHRLIAPGTTSCPGDVAAARLSPV